MTNKEKDVQKAILKALEWLPGFYYRMNTGLASFGNRKVKFGMNGQADITGILPDGKRIEIEVKGPTGTQSPEQEIFQANIEKNNGIYILAYSVDDVLKKLKLDGYIK